MTRDAAVGVAGGRAVAPRPTARSTDRRERVLRWGLPTGLVLLHVLLQLQARPNPRWNDAIFVLNFSRDYPDVPLTHHALRLGNLVPARALIDTIGYGQVAYYAWPFLMGIALVLATYVLGTALLNRYVGTVAGLLVVLSPILLWTTIQQGVERMTSWHLLPDIPTAAFFAAGLALLVHGAGEAAGRETGILRPGLLVAAGLCFGWAYLIRELTAFSFPAVLVALIAFRVPWRRWWVVAVPMLACLVFELLVTWWAFGDALARLRVGAEHSGVPREELTRTKAALGVVRALDNYPGFELLLFLLGLTLVGALVTRRRALVLCAVWFLSYWFPLTLVSGLLDPGLIRINMTLTRYWIPVLPPLLIGGTIVLALLYAAVARKVSDRALVGVRVTAVAATCAVLAAYVWPVLGSVVRHPGDAQWNALRTYLTQHDDSVAAVAADARSALILGIYQFPPVGGDPVWDARIDTFPHSLAEALPADGIEADLLLWTPESGARPTPEQGWTEVWTRAELSLYARPGSALAG